MRRAIILGELPPGSRLDEQWLADKFGVSRIPIREMFPLLERNGLVRIEPRRGVFVVGLSNEDIHDVYECRSVLEARSIRRVAETIDAEGLARLRELVDRVEWAMRNNQPDRIVAYDIAFHREIVVMAGNKRILAAWDMLVELISVLLDISSSVFRDVVLPYDPVAPQRHTKLLHFIETRNADAAEELLMNHLYGSEVAVREAIKYMREKYSAEASDPASKSYHR